MGYSKHHIRRQSSSSILPPQTRPLRQRREDLTHFPKLFAKPPPTSNFDLEAIEAFEKEIDLRQEDETNLSYGSDYLLSEEDDDDVDDNEYSNDNVQIFTVPLELDGKRIDTVLAALMESSLSRSVCGNLVANGHIRQQLDASDVLLDRKSQKIEAGTVLKVEIPHDDSTPDKIVPQNIPISILYEDQHMIVLNKAAGMVVHPAAGNWDGTVVNALAYHLAHNTTFGTGDFVSGDGTIRCIQTNNDNTRQIIKDDPVNDTYGDKALISFRPGIVHRLDKGTTGILVVAKTTQALSNLSAAFAARKVQKTYLAITVGNPGKQVVIDKPIGRHPIHRQRMRVVPDPHRKDSSGMTPTDRQRMRMTSSAQSPLSQSGRRALSYVDTLAFDGKLSLARVRIETGRTHQIRVHLQDRHTPIYGDDIYGIPDWNKQLKKTHGIERPLLHAYRLELQHPITGESMLFEAPMAEDMIGIAKSIWSEGPDELPNAFRTTGEDDRD